MKLSDLIDYCSLMIEKHGDHEVTRKVSGNGNYGTSSKITINYDSTRWIRQKTVAENEEVTTKKRIPQFTITIDEDIK